MMERRGDLKILIPSAKLSGIAGVKVVSCVCCVNPSRTSKSTLIDATSAVISIVLREKGPEIILETYEQYVALVDRPCFR